MDLPRVCELTQEEEAELCVTLRIIILDHGIISDRDDIKGSELRKSGSCGRIVNQEIFKNSWKNEKLFSRRLHRRAVFSGCSCLKTYFSCLHT